MNILIKGLEIPEDGYLDVRILSHGGLNSVTWNDLGCCPYAEAHDVVALPEKHGRLIDADALGDKMSGKWTVYDYQALGAMPTIVEAEGEDG